MKLFAIQAFGHYGGGMAVVAAESEERAMELAAKINDRQWHTRYDRPDVVTEISPLVEGVLHHFETGE